MRSVGLKRWWIVLIAFCVVAAVFCIAAVIPVLRIEIAEASQFAKDKRMQRYASDYPQQVAAAQERLKMLDSLLITLQNKAVYDQSAFMAVLYRLADSSDCRIDKVEVGERMLIDSVAENPLVLNGTGQYAAIGRLADGIENQSCPSRIRQILLTNAGEGKADFVLDFVVME